MNFDELVKKEAFPIVEVCQSGFDKLEKGKNDWVETPRSLKFYTIFNAWKKSGLLKTRKLELMAAYKMGEIFGKLNTQYKNESEWAFYCKYQKLNLTGQKIVLQLVNLLLNERSFVADIERKNVVRLVKK